MRSIILLLVFVIAGTTPTFSQTAKQKTCNDPKVHNKLVSVNKEFESKKYKLALFTTDNIPSKTYVPVRIKLEKGATYQIIFVASSGASRYELRVADQNKKELIKEKAKGTKGENHLIAKTITPTETGDYLIVVQQQTKGDECVGLSVLKK